MSETTATRTEWRIAGDEVASCNCAWACGCQFNGPPTYGHCEALVAFLIRTGHFGDLNLDGVRFAEAFYFPGAVHEGNGTRLVILDEADTEEQRSAVLELTSGTQGHPVFEIFASVTPNVLEPVVASIEVESDREARRARIAIPASARAVLSQFVTLSPARSTAFASTCRTASSTSKPRSPTPSSGG